MRKPQENGSLSVSMESRGHHNSLNESVTVTCVSSVPFLKKVKVLKKFKKRMGLSRNLESSPQPPLQFHSNCGDNVRIESGGRTARRVESFCKGIAFSNRNVKIGERVYLCLQEVSKNWSGVLRFGFTCHDPSTIQNLPKYACPDLTNRPGFWAKALSEKLGRQGTVLFYYVNQAGEVHFGLNGEERGVFFSRVDTRAPLYVILDIYGNSTCVEFLDPLSQLNNRLRILNDLRPGASSDDSRVLSLPQPSTGLQRRVLPARPLSVPPNGHSCSPTNAPEVERLQPSMAQLAVSTLSNCSRNSSRLPMPFHRVKGRNVILNNDRTVASRLETEYSHGYVFTGIPLAPGEALHVKVLSTERLYVGSLAFGMTSADPAGLDSSDLPEDCDLLLDRPEYWVVSKDVAASPSPGDDLVFAYSHSGEVTFSCNSSAPNVVMHVDHSLKLWAFLDVYGNTKKIKSCGITQSRNPVTQMSNSHIQNQPQDLQITLPRVSPMRSDFSASHIATTVPSRTFPPPPSISPPPIPLHSPPDPVVTISPILSRPSIHANKKDNQICYTNNQSCSHINPQCPPLSHTYSPPLSTTFPTHTHPSPSNIIHNSPHQLHNLHLHGTIKQNSSNSPASNSSPPTYIMEPPPQSPYIAEVPNAERGISSHQVPNMENHECTVCYEKGVDSVLYTCGHLCMCYECAIQQWRGRGGGQCPICRAHIKDVIRIYRS